MSTDVEDRLRRALRTRAGQVTPEQLQPALPPTATAARRSWRPWWRSLVVVAAALVAVVLAVRPDAAPPRPAPNPPAATVPPSPTSTNSPAPIAPNGPPSPAKSPTTTAGSTETAPSSVVPGRLPSPTAPVAVGLAPAASSSAGTAGPSGATSR
jgi:hypothetical protein